MTSPHARNIFGPHLVRQKACRSDKLPCDEFPLSELCHRRDFTPPSPRRALWSRELVCSGGALAPYLKHCRQVIFAQSCWIVLPAAADQTPTWAAGCPRCPCTAVSTPPCAGLLQGSGGWRLPLAAVMAYLLHLRMTPRDRR